MKKIVFFLIGLMMVSSFVPIITANTNLNDDFNLRAEIEPFRKVFPRMYTLLVKAQFDCSYHRENGEYPGGDSFTFQVTRLADGEIIYSEDKEMGQLLEHNSGHGTIIAYTCYSGIRRFASLYEAKITLNVDDSDPSDNEASCYFIVIETI